MILDLPTQVANHKLRHLYNMSEGNEIDRLPPCINEAFVYEAFLRSALYSVRALPSILHLHIMLHFLARTPSVTSRPQSCKPDSRSTTWSLSRRRTTASSSAPLYGSHEYLMLSTCDTLYDCSAWLREWSARCLQHKLERVTSDVAPSTEPQIPH